MESNGKSLGALTATAEAFVAGVAAAVFPGFGGPGTARLEETEAFLIAYEQARGQRWSTEEWEVGWAAGLWVRAYNAKKHTLDGNGSSLLDQLASEAAERLRLAGA
jgi:hypothetical protein